VTFRYSPIFTMSELLAEYVTRFSYIFFIQNIFGNSICIVSRRVNLKLHFDREKRRLSLPVVKGFGYLIRYHMGTVAFGALIIGIVRLIRAMISFVQKHLKRYDNAFVQGILWCCQCCLWCFECALKFLTRNAYIETGDHLTSRVL